MPSSDMQALAGRMCGVICADVIICLPLQQHGLFRAKQSKNPFKVGTAERKLLIIFCYYVVLGVIALTTFTVTTRNVELFTEELGQYFLCEAVGPEDPCDRSGFEELTHPELVAVSYVLLGIFPVFNVVFAVNVNELKQFRVQVSRLRHVPRSSDYPSVISTSSAL